MKRIVVLGATGSGKTMLGKTLSEKLKMPAIDLDEIHWLPGWQERDHTEARRMIDEATQKPEWVISGNYKKFQDIFWPRADVMIWLDYPFYFVFMRLLNRSLRRVVGRQAICNGNYETWKKLFSKDSIIVWLFKSYWRRKKEFGDIFSHPEQYPHWKLVRLKSAEETETWLNAAVLKEPSLTKSLLPLAGEG